MKGLLARRNSVVRCITTPVCLCRDGRARPGSHPPNHSIDFHLVNSVS